MAAPGFSAPVVRVSRAEALGVGDVVELNVLPGPEDALAEVREVRDPHVETHPAHQVDKTILSMRVAQVLGNLRGR